MVIRKPTLSEWFLKHQLQKIEKTTFHLPITLTIDITALAAAYKNQQKKVPVNALVLKALGAWARENPVVNRSLFKTFCGDRFLEFPEVRINFPIEIEKEGQKFISAIVIKDPDLKSVEAIHREIKETKNRDLQSFKINHFLRTRKNHVFNRLFLRAMHYALMSMPLVYYKQGGGGISYSSLTHATHPQMALTVIARGNTGFTFCLNTLEETPTASYLHLGVSFDHNCHAGADMARYLAAFSQKLSSLPVD